MEAGVLYVVATPIGNLEDLGRRGMKVLDAVAVIAAEDTRHTARLLRHYAIRTPTVSLHQHNEKKVSARLAERLQSGESMALVSDAGTPLLSDPGMHLVRAARSLGVRIVPIPGPSAITSALSVSSFPADRFVFEGFLPAKSAARVRRLREVAGDARTLVFFEAPHRVLETVTDMAEIFGADRRAGIARELSKVFEEIFEARLSELLAWLETRPERIKGEFVITVEGAGPVATDRLGPEDVRLLSVLLEHLPASKASAVAARLTGKKKRVLYAQALELGSQTGRKS
ncbi:MAG: 16S rRNA (cytidine(1402)-2'-O)-methyltransferase [Gammaproteobacteria bacterium]|nr:16S rRNA (cytidine(1402)-2'-O)-methyltransferase [Gammaproteobacteria bacterium]